MRRPVGTALAVLLGFLAAAVPASASAGVPDQPRQPQLASKSVTNATFGAAPATAKGADGSPYFTFNSSPGGQITTYVEVFNFSARRLHLNVYTVDAFSATNGDIAFQTHGAPRRQAGAWMAVGTPAGKGVITLKPRTHAILPVHVVIPANAPPGDTVGAVVVSLNGKVTGTFGNGSKEGAKFEQRLAVRSVFRISGPIHPLLSIGDLKARYDGPIDPFAKGHTTFSYTVHNGGNVVLGGPQTVSVHGVVGEKVNALKVADLPPLLPGANYPVTIRVPGVYPELLMNAKVTINPAGLQGAVDPGLHPVTSSVHFFAIPWLPSIVVLLLILGLAWRYTRRRRKRAPAVPASSVAEVKELRGVPQG